MNRIGSSRNPPSPGDLILAPQLLRRAHHLVGADRKAQISTLPLPENTVASDKEVHRVMLEWVPLAKFGLPEEEYVNGRFLIRHEDLAAHRFDEALSFCEFTE